MEQRYFRLIYIPLLCTASKNEPQIWTLCYHLNRVMQVEHGEEGRRAFENRIREIFGLTNDVSFCFSSPFSASGDQREEAVKN